MDRTEKTDIMMALLRVAIAGAEAPAGLCDTLSEEDVRSMLALCGDYDVSEALFAALVKCGAVSRDDGVYSAFTEVQERNFFRCKRLEHTLSEIGRSLTDAHIDYVPLKGAVMRSYYPSPMMRMSADVDVLVRERDLNSACRALEAVGFAVKGKKGFHDISLYSPDGMHLELHYNIKENDSRLDPTLERAFDYLVPSADGGYERRFTPEFFAFHLLTHMTYHFINGGCGIRPFADLWIWRHRVGYDDGAVRELCRECGIETFYEKAIMLSEVWFSGAPHTLITRRMEDHVIYNSVYGSATKGIVLRQSKHGGRLGYILSRIFMPYSQLKIRYPIVGKIPPLLPVFEVVRWVSFLFGDKKAVRDELGQTKRISAEQMNGMKQLLSDVGL